jgi:thymidine kinase
MAKLLFRFGAMGASKTANALMVRFNYIERGMKVDMLKPEKDTRDTTIKSRIGLECECTSVEKYLEKYYSNGRINITAFENDGEPDAVIVDEAQFLEPEDVDKLADIVDMMEIPVICYGLKTDFQGNLFPGSKRLIELADEIEEIPTICWCGKKAHFNARISNGKIIKIGPQVQAGGNESYVSLCRKHFKYGILPENFS